MEKSAATAARSQLDHAPRKYRLFLLIWETARKVCSLSLSLSLFLYRWTELRRCRMGQESEGGRERGESE